MSDEVYSPERQQRLVELLRRLAQRIAELRDADLLDAGPELMKLMGDARSELFHYEVRCTYDTPEIAESRRIVEQARRAAEFDPAAHDDDEPWRGE
jgi:hypothetical protein